MGNRKQFTAKIQSSTNKFVFRYRQSNVRQLLPASDSACMISFSALFATQDFFSGIGGGGGVNFPIPLPFKNNGPSLMDSNFGVCVLRLTTIFCGIDLV